MAESRQPRRWPVALGVAFVNGIAGALLCLPVAMWGMRIHHASRFEGSSDFGVIFIWMPLAAIIGFLVGFGINFTTRRHGFPGYALRQGIALVAIAGLIALGGGLTYATVVRPRVPTIDGKPLALQIELRVPTNGRTIEQLRATGFDARVDEDPDDRSNASPIWRKAVRTGEFITVPMWENLHSTIEKRQIPAWDAHESYHHFKVAIPASPQKIDDEWSDWIISIVRPTANNISEVMECHARYRVRFAADRPK